MGLTCFPKTGTLLSSYEFDGVSLTLLPPGGWCLPLSLNLWPDISCNQKNVALDPDRWLQPAWLTGTLSCPLVAVS